MVEQAAVNRKVVGSSPTSGATVFEYESRQRALNPDRQAAEW